MLSSKPPPQIHLVMMGAKNQNPSVDYRLSRANSNGLSKGAIKTRNTGRLVDDGHIIIDRGLRWAECR